MRVVCEGCGRPFSALRSSARFCSSRCRSRAHVSGKRAVRLALVPPSSVAVDAVRAELATLGVPADELLAVEALVVAEHLDVADGSATAPLARLLRELMGEVRLAAGRLPGGRVDEIQRRRGRWPRGVGPGGE